MEVTRLRELTHDPHMHLVGFPDSRNGSYPIKGIDTPFLLMKNTSVFCRNGSYPIKGIDTFPPFSNQYIFWAVEMEVTRLRELIQTVRHFSCTRSQL